jgi:hypothetical protein
VQRDYVHGDLARSDAKRGDARFELRGGWSRLRILSGGGLAKNPPADSTGEHEGKRARES